jgi:glutaredoxin
LTYTEFKLGKDFTKAEHYEKFGMNATFPKVEIDDEVIGGSRDTVEWLKKARYVPGN